MRLWKKRIQDEHKSTKPYIQAYFSEHSSPPHQVLRFPNVSPARVQTIIEIKGPKYIMEKFPRLVTHPPCNQPKILRRLPSFQQLKTNVLTALKDPILYTATVLTRGFSYTSFTEAMILLGLGDVCPSASTFYRTLPIIQEAVAVVTERALSEARSLITSPRCIGFDAGWAHCRNSRQCFGGFIDIETGMIIDFFMGWLLVGNSTDKIAARLASDDHHMEAYKGYPQTMEPRIFRKIFPHWANSDSIIGLVQDNEHDHHGMMKKLWAKYQGSRRRYVDVNHNVKHFIAYTKKVLGKQNRFAFELEKWIKFLLHNKELTEERKIELWDNTVNHFKGDHTLCVHGERESRDWNITASEEALLSRISKEGAKFITLSNPHYSTQFNESLNAIRCAIADKRTSWKTSWQTRSLIAVCKWNMKERAFIEIMKELRVEVPRELELHLCQLHAAGEARRTKQKEPSERNKRQERRRFIAKALRKKLPEDDPTICSSSQEAVNRSECSQVDTQFDTDDDETFVDEESQFMEENLTDSDSGDECESIYKEEANYVPDEITAEDLEMFFTDRDEANAHVPSNRELGYTGITNRNNSCYFNATMQLMAFCVRENIADEHPVRIYMEETIGLPSRETGCPLPEVSIPSSGANSAHNSQPEEETLKCISFHEKLRSAFAILIKGEDSIVDLDDLHKDVVKRIADPTGELEYGGQNDPYDIIPFLISEFQGAFGVDEFSIILQRVVTTKHPEPCVSVTKPLGYPCIRLNLGSAATDVQSLCDENLSITYEQYKCEEHAIIAEASAEEVLVDIPSNIMLVLERNVLVDEDDVTCTRKINKRIDTPMTLYISKETDETLSFRLVGVICHYGVDECGHFVTYVMEKDRVIKLNDRQASVATLDEIAQIDTHSYVLAYKCIGDMTPENDEINDKLLRDAYRAYRYSSGPNPTVAQTYKRVFDMASGQIASVM